MHSSWTLKNPSIKTQYLMLIISTSKEALNPRKGVLRLKHTPIGLYFYYRVLLGYLESPIG
jgi:hypothetical protein